MWEDNIKIDLGDIGWNGMGQTELIWLWIRTSGGLL
jgi:hypothetical protein